MKTPFFTGTCTALVTPFLNGQVNYPMLERLLQRQMDAGIRTVVICGTTGEASTLTDDEKLELIRRAKEYVGDSMTVIAGTGSNCTEHAVWLSEEAQNRGADAVLVVSPYYNKATEEGLFAHYASIADAVTIPVILYNVPSRTGFDISVSACRRLSRIGNIVGIKEAGTSIGKITNILAQCGPLFSVWSGNDDMTVPLLSLGGQGVISVVSNVVPELVEAMTSAGLAGDFDTAAALQQRLQPLCEVLFREVNPVPVKSAMKILGFDCGDCRLPLTKAKAETEMLLKRLLKKGK